MPRMLCSTVKHKPTPDARALQRAMSSLLNKTASSATGKGMADLAHDDDVEPEPDMDESHTEVAPLTCCHPIPALPSSLQLLSRSHECILASMSWHAHL